MKVRSAALAILALSCLCSCDTGLVAEAKKNVRSQALDPDAAQFREVQLCSHDENVVSGEVNAKNSFGAYTGFRPFFYSAHRVATPDDLDRFYELMRRCYDMSILTPSQRAQMIETERVAKELRAQGR